MSRRLTAEQRAELPQRAQAATGLDHQWPTGPDGVPAQSVYDQKPSEDARRWASHLRLVIEKRGGADIVVTADQRGYGQHGVLTVNWNSGPTVATVAAAVTNKATPEGLPLLPGWITLARDDEFDLRWQQPY